MLRLVFIKKIFKDIPLAVHGFKPYNLLVYLIISGLFMLRNRLSVCIALA
ncbi:hypothetical protein Hanom_Chr16g01476421 [Helianthus anomalus]